MDHDFIAEQEVVERYVRGALAPEEAARFEEHYLACPECLDRIDLAEAMGRGFKRAAGQEAAALAVARPLALVAWLSRLGRGRQTAALVLLGALFAGLPGILAWREARELRAVRSAMGAERAASAGGGGTETMALRHELLREREARAAAESQLERAARPQANVPILFLDAERGAGAPSHSVRLPSERGWIVLSLPVEGPHPSSYRATLRDAQGRELWRGEGLRVNDMESLSLSLPTSLLVPGDCVVTVEAPTSSLRFAFRVFPAR